MRTEDIKSVFQKLIKESLPDIIRQGRENIRLGRVYEASNTSKTASVQILGSGEVVKSVKIPVNATGLTVADLVTVVAPDIRQQGQNFILGYYNTNVVTGVTNPNPVITGSSLGNNVYTGGSFINSVITNPSIVGASITGGSWLTWNPTYTGITVGNGTVVARYAQIGEVVHINYQITFGSSSQMGNGILSLPLDAHSRYTALRNNIGNVYILDSGTAEFIGTVRIEGATSLRPVVTNAAGTYASVTSLSASVPMTWATNDILFISGTYEAA